MSGKNKKFDYDQTELQSLVRPSSISRTSSISSSSFSGLSHFSHNSVLVDQPVPTDLSSDQIRIVATHPPPHSAAPLDIVDQYPTPDQRPHDYHPSS